VTASLPRLGRPVAADGDQTRVRVLEIARTAFSELGYATTTYRLLAERAKLAPSALYNYFGSKAELYAAVHNEVQLETYTKWIMPAIEGTTTFSGRLAALLDSFVAMNANAPEAALFQATARVDTARYAELSAVREGLPAQRRNLFTDLVDLGISTGELDAEARATTLAMLEALTLGLLEISHDRKAHCLAIEGFKHAINAMLANQR
jgi:AcrR family transcriptional regulator